MFLHFIFKAQFNGYLKFFFSYSVNCFFSNHLRGIFIFDEKCIFYFLGENNSDCGLSTEEVELIIDDFDMADIDNTEEKQGGDEEEESCLKVSRIFGNWRQNRQIFTSRFLCPFLVH